MSEPIKATAEQIKKLRLRRDGDGLVLQVYVSMGKIQISFDGIKSPIRELMDWRDINIEELEIVDEEVKESNFVRASDARAFMNNHVYKVDIE